MAPQAPKLSRVPSVSEFGSCPALSLPEMSSLPSALSLAQASSLFLSLPPRLQVQPWTRLFSTNTEGCSLSHLYSTLRPYHGHLLLAIQDTEGVVFGAVLSSPNIKMTRWYRRCKGNAADTLLFSFHPSLRTFVPTGSDDYYLHCLPDCLAVGGGLPGIWLDDSLDRGSSHASTTFGNTTALGGEKDFRIRRLECWALDSGIFPGGSVDLHHGCGQ